MKPTHEQDAAAICKRVRAGRYVDAVPEHFYIVDAKAGETPHVMIEVAGCVRRTLRL